MGWYQLGELNSIMVVRTTPKAMTAGSGDELAESINIFDWPLAGFDDGAGFGGNGRGLNGRRRRHGGSRAVRTAANQCRDGWHYHKASGCHGDRAAAGKVEDDAVTLR